MTFLHKLAKRLALIGATPALVVSFLGSCTEGTASEYLGPDPHKPSSTSTYIGLSIYPTDPQLVLGDSIKLQARGWLPSGLSTPAAVTWSANGATVSSDGWFRATSLGVFRVRAAALAAAGMLDEIVITVSTSGGIARLDVTPSAPSLPAGTSQQFTAVALMKDGSRSTATPVTWTAEGGQIDKNGVFKAGNGQGGYKVKASADSTVQGETAGDVAPAVLTQLHLNPSTSTLEPGEELEFSASATWSDGSTELPMVTYSATGGVITPGGVYTAGGTQGDYRVIVSGQGKADTANVTIMAGVRGLRVAPLTAVLALGATQQLQAYAARSDGSETQVPVQWTAQGGSISANGSYTAGSVAGNYAIVGTLATATGQVFKDTAHFQVGSSAATLTTLEVRSDTSLKVGSTAQFTVVGSWSDGGSAVPSVTWSASGGSITANGFYTAPSEPSTQKIFAKDKNGTKADTAVVQVLAQQENQVTGFTISPATTILSIGQTRQFSTALSWSDGKAHPVDISWVSAGGTITQNGLYTAGQLAGTFLIVATCSCGVADTASVSIPAGTAAPVTLTQVVLSPATAQVAASGSKQFSVSGVWSDGSTAKPAVTYLAEGGTISTTGLFVAASTPGSYMVIATQAGGGPADTAVVTVGAVTLTLTGLSLNPAAVYLAPGEAAQIAAVGSWSDGSSSSPPVTWTATGGTISSAGLYTAGSATGSFQISALHAGSGLTASMPVSIGSAAPQGGTVALPEAPRQLVDVTYPAVTGKTISVASGGNLQNAINSAACGDEIVLAAGAVFTGNFILPNKSCTKYIVIRSAGTLPAIGTRVTPATAAGFAKILAPGVNVSPVATALGAGYYRLVGIEVTAPATETALNALVKLSTTTTMASQLPHHIILDRMYIHGHATLGLSRCVMMNSAWTAVVDSYLDDCHTKGSDSQAIVSWNGTGPFLIENNYLAGAAENILFGGSDPSIQGLIPSDVVIRRNHFHKPASWQGKWTSKALLEFKNVQRVLVEGNVFENNWIDGQAGHAFNWKSENQNGTAPWSVTRDVNFQYNVIWKSACGMKVSSGGHVNGTSAQVERIRIAHNVLADIGVTYGGCSSLFQFQYDIADLTLEYNTGWAANSAIVFYGLPAMQRVSIRGNILGRGAYGMKGDATGEGTNSLNKFAPGATVTGNLILGAPASSYPAGNSFPSSINAAGLVTLDNILWSLSPSSAYLASGPGGTSPGADVAAIRARTAGVRP